MELRPPAEPLPELFAPVHRRHPDVDIVLTPAPPGEPVDADSLDAERAATRLSGDLELVAGSVADAWAAVTGVRSEVRAAPAFGPREDTVVARARHHGRPPQPPGPALVAHLAAGWGLAAPRGETGPLVARRGRVELVATYAEGSGVLVVTATAAPIRVGVARARSLVP
ncbi:hypothetical protein [Nocardioides pantholopis]|uniref:hypothetical protein n=1 Tax=Nocardioides pantholopis TaxID=2483798 RepID=UPI000F090107|nr:hypothetical protein [Nocardioides pantholopis]